MAVEGRLLDYLGPDASGSSSLDKASIIVERFQGGSDAQDKRQALQAMELLLKTRPTAEAVSVTVPVLRYVLGSGLMLADPGRDWRMLAMLMIVARYVRLMSL